MHRDSFREMINIVAQHFSFNRILLLALGLWPYYKSKLARVQLGFLFGTLISFIICQLMTFFTSKCTVQLTIKILSSAVFFFTFAIKYNTFCVNMDAVKLLLEKLQHICDELKDNNEIAIIIYYGDIARRYTILLTLFGIFLMFIFSFLQISPHILDAVLSVNKTRLNGIMVFEYEHFLDQERYFYLTLLHYNVALLIGGTAMLASGITIISYFQHACGLFKIASYRIERAMRMDLLQNINMKKENLICEGIISGVDMHRKAMSYTKLILSSFKITYMVLMVVMVISLSLNLFQILFYENFKIEAVMMPITILNVHFMYMFIANNMSQNIMDHNNNVFDSTYNVQWYVTPLYIQRITLFILQRSAQTFTMKLGGIFVTSLEGFSMLVKASVSYFTFLYSTKK